MATEKEIRIIIRTLLKNEKFKKELKKQSATMKTANKSMEKQGGLLKNMRAGYLAVAAAIGATVAAANKFVQAALVQDKAQRTLAAAMQQAGTFTQKAFKHNLEYASSLQRMTAFGDEAILGIQKMLTNFGVEGKMLDELTKQTLNLAAAKGMDLKAAADLVSKSVGSSTNALARYGIQVEGGAGSTERMQSAVQNISKLFGGAAAAEANTYAGQMQQIKNHVGDLSEVIGLELLRSLKDTTKEIKAFVADPKAMEGLRRATIGVIAGVKFLIENFKTFFRVAKVFISPLVEAINGIVKAIAVLTDETTKPAEKFEKLKEIGINAFNNVTQGAIDAAMKTQEGYTSIITGLIDSVQQGNEMVENSFEQTKVKAKSFEDYITKIFSDTNKKRIKIAGDFATQSAKLGDTLLAIEQNRLNAMDEADTEGREKQKKKMVEMAKLAKKINQAQAIIDMAAGIVSAFNPYIPFVSEAMAALVAGVGAAQVGLIESTPLPSFQRGINEVPQNQLANLHQGERVLPSGMNISGVSNAQYADAALRGLGMGIGDTYNNTTTNNQKYVTLNGTTINTPDADNLLNQLEELAEDTGTRMLART